MLENVNMTLFVGPAVPIPVAPYVIDALQSVEVTQSAGRHGAFQLRFALPTDSPLHTLFLVSGGGALPLVRVVVMVTVNGAPEVLIDGVVTTTSVSPGASPTQATLTVTGEDMSRVMDYIDFSGFPFPGMAPEARAALIIAKYSMFGVTPVVIPSVLIDQPIPTDRIPKQVGTDLRYISRLARDVGYVFYFEPGVAPGQSFGYWGPEIRIGVPQPALNLNFDAEQNVGQMSFGFDTTKRELPVLFVQNQETKVPIPIPLPDVTPLSPPLGLVEPIPKRVVPVRGTAKLSPLRAALVAMAKAAKSADAASATGSLDVARYGRVLKARRLVGVRGAGVAFDGLYFVKTVTHKISRGSYTQDFTLVRNGLVSTLPKVPA